MNILIDINHPAHVHLFKNLIWELNKNGHNTYITVKKIQSAIELLERYGFKYYCIGQKSDSLYGKAFNQLKYNIALHRIVRKQKIDIGVGSSITVDHISKITKMKSIHLSDDDASVVPLTVKYAYPFANVILSPNSVTFNEFIDKNITYSGFHELAYLHPNRFKPDPNILSEINLKKNDPYFVLRFNSFKAHHDVDVRGLSIENKRKLVELLKPFGKVLITTENSIDKEFQEYQIRIEPHKIHSLLYYSTMFVGDSQTMTSESAVLGIPAIRSNSFVGRIGYLEEEEHKYGLTFGFKPDDPNKLFRKIEELLNTPNLKDEWHIRRNKMLNDKIDVTAFFVWFIENYPESVRIMQDNPDYQFNFK